MYVCNNNFSNKGNLKRHLKYLNVIVNMKKKEREKQIEILEKQINDLKNQPITNQIYNQILNKINNNQQINKYKLLIIIIMKE